MMIVKSIASFLIILIAGCSVITTPNDLESSERKYHDKVSKTVLIYMDLETMFPDPALRDLARAASKGNINSIQKLVNEGIDVNGKGTKDATPLFWAMKNKKGFKKLLELGADPNIIYGDGGTVMHWLVRNEENELLRMAIQHGGNPNLKAGLFNSPVIFEAIKIGYNKGISETFYILVEAGSDLELRNEIGNTILLLAANLARYDYVLELLKLKANHQVKDNKGHDLQYLVDDHIDAFNAGSDTENNWRKVKQFLESQQ